MPNKELDEAKLRDAAYQLWLADGQPEGRDQEHWHKAVEALSTEPEAEPKAKAPRKAAPKAATKAPAKPKAPAKAPAKPRKPKAV
jgi:hypothetical protein